MATRSARPRGVTRADVAKLAGVSTAVVSYTLNGGPKPVAPATRQRVLDAVKKLGYRPNAAARALSLGRADLIGLVVPTVEQHYFAHLTAAFERAARAFGLALVVANANPADRVAGVVRELVGQQLRGIVLASEVPADAMRELLASGVPAALINHPAGLGAEITLAPEFRAGTVSAVTHLVQVHGHREIAYVGGDLPTDERAAGWREALRSLGADPRVAIEVPYTLAGGRDAMRELLQGHVGLKAAFFASDQLALGALAGLHEAGLRAPDDFALVSFDGSPEAEFAVPPLTTVNVPIEEMAQEAVARMLDPVPAGHLRFATELVIRHSCGCP